MISKKCNTIVLFFTLLFHSFLAIAQETPKYEFRAVWVASVVNIDWPSKPGLSTSQQQNEALAILDKHQANGMNTIILQVRPSSDAFYTSKLEPWSRYLTGTPGQAPKPYYDPLDFWVTECHKRGMELHAWLNPYRVAQKSEEALAGDHIAFKHPEWIIKYGERLYFDPGIDAARDFVIGVVKDIVSRYDVDGIHFDDYFYPYPLQEDFPDTTSFANNNRGFTLENKADWRRNNVDITIKMLNDTIKSVKPWVKFGISPFGVWRNIADDPNGSNTRAGATNYDHLYADVIKWQKEGWIDYLLPQLYWHIGHPLVDFDLLANWWKQHAYGRGMYIGQAPYRVNPDSNTKEWTEPDQLPKQIRILRDINEIGGSAFFSSKSFNGNLLGFQDSLKLDLYQKPAVVPPMSWLDDTPPKGVVRIKKSGRKVKWTVEEENQVLDKAHQYIIYINESGKIPDLESAGNLHKITRSKKFRFSRINKKRKRYEVRVTVLDRMNNESIASDPVVIKL